MSSETYLEAPNALELILGELVAEQRKEFEREIGRIAADARAVVANLETKVAHLEVANEALRADLRKRVDDEVERIREMMALVKDGNDGKDGDQGPRGPQGEQGEPGKAASAEEIVPLVLGLIPPPEKGEKGDRGKDADIDEIMAKIAVRLDALAAEQRQAVQAVADEVRGESAAIISDLYARLHTLKDGAKGDRGDPGPAGADGKDPDPEFIACLVDEMVTQAISVLPPPEKGDPGDPGRDGKNAEVDYELIFRELRGDLSRMVAELPPPEKGEKGEKGDRGDPGPDVDYDIIARMIDNSIKQIPAPKDGVGLAGAFRGHDGNLVLTLTDGTLRELGNINGKDGEPGKDGRDGKDGLSFDAFVFEPEWDGERTLRLRWSDAKGNEQVRELRLPIMLYREIYKSNVQYEAGDAVRYGGSLWLATQNTSEKPGDGCKDWRLVARAGRDGRDGAKGDKGEKGDRGQAGPERLITGGG